MTNRDEREKKIEYLEYRVRDYESKMITESIQGMPIVGTETMLKHFKEMLAAELQQEEEDNNSGKEDE
jgi:hypothetical protein